MLVTHSINISCNSYTWSMFWHHHDFVKGSLACLFHDLPKLSKPTIATHFLATSIQTQHPSLTSSDYIEPIGRERISPWASSIVNFIFSSRNQFVFVAADEISCNTSAGNKHCYFLVHPSNSQYPLFFLFSLHMLQSVTLESWVFLKKVISLQYSWSF